MAIDQAKLEELLHKVVGDLGATISAGNSVVGYRLGLFTALAERPMTSAELASATDTDERYVREWARGQAAGGYITYDPAADAYSLTEEQVAVVADPDGAVYAPAAFLLSLAALRSEPRVTEAFRTGTGMGWHEHNPDLFVGTEQFFRPGYLANLVASWIPALDGIEERLRAGGKVADIGCGLGSSTVLMAKAYPQSRFVGSDYHGESIELARKRAADAGVADRVAYEIATAQTFGGSGYDLVTTFDALHDMGDPLGAARHVREALAPDGMWMIVEPFAGDKVEDNLNPIGRIFYNASTFLCVPNARSQEGDYELGAQAGPAAIREITERGGFTRFRQAAETPFNLVYEVRA